MPFARRMLVEERRWLSAEEITDVLSLCQLLWPFGAAGLIGLAGWV